MTPEKYPAPAVVSRVCRLLVVLAGNTVNGLATGELAKALGISESNITRTVAHLINEGFVEEAAIADRWRLGPKLVQIARAYEADIARRQGELDQIKQRYGAFNKGA